MANENEVNTKSFSSDEEEQNDIENLSYDELLEILEAMNHDLRKLVKKNKLSKKQVDVLLKEKDDLNNEINILTSTLENKDSLLASMDKLCDDLVKENEILKKEVVYLKSSLGKFTSGKNNLDAILESQRILNSKVGLGYTQTSTSSNAKTVFVKASTPRPKSHTHAQAYTSRKNYVHKIFNGHCYHCGKYGHTQYNCYHKRQNTRLIWVVKGTMTNQDGPKQWVPKTL
jgi:chromosome segregation ATPase